MFLRNFYNALVCCSGFMNDLRIARPDSDASSATCRIGNLGGVNNFGDGIINWKSTNATIQDIKIDFYQGYRGRYASFLTCLATDTICLGDGNSAVTFDDYKLSGNVVANNLVQVSNTVASEVADGFLTKTMVARYSNTTDTDITISEWGIYTGGLDAYDNNGNSILLYREVLDTPITIAAGTTTTMTFKVNVSMLNRVEE